MNTKRDALWLLFIGLLFASYYFLPVILFP